MIRFACPACGKIYKADSKLAGKEMICKKCSVALLIPEQPIREVHYGNLLPSDYDPDPYKLRSRFEPSDKVEKEVEANIDERVDEPLEDKSDSPERPKPGKVTAMGGMLIGGGAWAVLNAVTCALIYPLCCAWPGIWYGLIWAIFAVIRGSELLGQRWYVTSPRTLITLQIVQAINLDVVNVVLGIVGHVFLKERDVESSFRNREA